MKQTKKEMLQGIEEKVEKSKLIDNSTLLIDYKDGTKAIRFHNTDILSEKDGVLTLNSGGWRSRTTKDRINQYAKKLQGIPYIWQKNHQWYIGEGVFYDGMQFRNGGQISEIKEDNAKKRNDILKRISKYCALVTKDNLPIPDSGDCWYCLMKDDSGSCLGDLSSNHGHLISHLEENYLHGSILVNAMREAGYEDRQISYHYQGKLHFTFQRALRKYLVKRLIIK